MKQIFLWCALAIAAHAQAQDSRLKLLQYVPRQAVRFSPLHLVNFYPTLEFSAEQRLYKQLTLVGEYGHVFNYSNSNQYSHKRGYKAKTELRYYFVQVKRLTVYGAGEYYWNAIRFDRWAQRLEYYGNDLDFPIVTKYAYPVVYDEYGFCLKGGFLLNIPHNMFFDFNAGFRLRVIDYDKPELPYGETDVYSDDFLTPDEADRTVLRLVAGIRFGYRFR